MTLSRLDMSSCVTGSGASYYKFGGQELYIYTVSDRMFGDFPAKKTVYTP